MSAMPRPALALGSAALALLLGAGAAHGYDAEAAKQLNKEQADLLERLRQMSVWPQHLPNLTRAQPKPNLVGTEQVIEAVYKPHVIYRDRGGKISDYYGRYAAMAKQGYDVEIRGSCESACTLAVALIPKERICFSDYAALRFHKARMPDGTPTSYYTQQMVDSYPADIRKWIVAMGGVEKMPVEDYWTLHATILWALGYRRCKP